MPAAVAEDEIREDLLKKPSHCRSGRSDLRDMARRAR